MRIETAVRMIGGEAVDKDPQLVVPEVGGDLVSHRLAARVKLIHHALRASLVRHRAVCARYIIASV